MVWIDNLKEHMGHNGTDSRGVEKVKCYITHAHIINNLRHHLPNPNAKFVFTTVKTAKKMIETSYGILAIVHDPRNIKRYRHRCEVVWHPNDHVKEITLTQLVKLCYYVRKYVLDSFKIKPIPVGLTPRSCKIQQRTIRII